MRETLLSEDNTSHMCEFSKVGYFEIVDLGNGFYEANIEIELTHFDDSVDVYSQYIPLSKEILKPLYESLKGHFDNDKD